MTKTKLLIIGICLFAAVAAQNYFGDSSNIGEEFDCDEKYQACNKDSMCASKMNGMWENCSKM